MVLPTIRKDVRIAGRIEDEMVCNTLALQDVYMARQRMTPIAQRTQLIASSPLSRLTGGKVYLKAENLQVTGSFKLRGAANKISSLSQKARQRGVIAVSSGNHGRAVSYVAKRLGVQATVVVSRSVPQNKCEAIRDLGAELIVAGADADEAMQYADRLTQERGLTMVHPFDDPRIIAGQGTIGLEIMEDLPNVDRVLAPLSGGGLISGIAFAIKASSPHTQVIGVSMEQGPAMVDSLKEGRIVDVDEKPSLADALVGGLNKDNRYTFNMVQRYVDETILVSEDEIAAGMRFAVEQHQLIVEGGGAVGLAALLSGKLQAPGETIAVVLSGANVSRRTLARVIAA